MGSTNKSMGHSGVTMLGVVIFGVNDKSIYRSIQKYMPVYKSQACQHQMIGLIGGGIIRV